VEVMTKINVKLNKSHITIKTKLYKVKTLIKIVLQVGSNPGPCGIASSTEPLELHQNAAILAVKVAHL